MPKGGRLKSKVRGLQLKSGWSFHSFAANFDPSMPFPLAHPAAILPLRRYCPRYLSFPALIIGSLSPDVGYFFGHFRLGEFSHRLLPGSFGFCLPVGLVLVLVFYIARLPVVGILLSSDRRAFLPLCQRPAGSPFLIVSPILFIALASRGAHQLIGIVPAGIITVLLLIGFLLATGKLFSRIRGLT